MSRISILLAPPATRDGFGRGSVRTALHERRPVSEAAVGRATRDLLIALGADLEREGLREAPRRMATVCLALLTPEPVSMTTFPNDESYDELDVVRDIRFQSRCMHHVLPCLHQQLQPKGVGVMLEAEHLCMSLRGVQKPGAKTVTSALHGLVREDPRPREEFLSLSGGRTG